MTRLCYDAREKYVLVQLTPGTYYHYCAVPSDVGPKLARGRLLGKFFNAQIKGRFDCRVTAPPTYR